MTVPKEILQSIRGVKPLSKSTMKLLEIMENPKHNLDQVVKIIELDAVLTASILRIVNSTAFSAAREITSVSRALPILGEKMVVGVALGLCAPHVFNDPLDGYESERGALWRHSLRTAILARELSAFAVKPVSKDLAYTAGLLHDIGKSVISSYVESRARQIVFSVDSGDSADYLEAERNILKTDHAEVGGALAKHWRLPDVLCTLVRNHHHPSKAPKSVRPLLFVVHLADIVSMMGGDGTGTDAMMYELDTGYKEFVDISVRELESTTLSAEDEFRRNTDLMFPQEQSIS